LALRWTQNAAVAGGLCRWTAGRDGVSLPERCIGGTDQWEPAPWPMGRSANGNTMVTVHEDMYVTNLIFGGLFKMGYHGISSHRVSFSKNLDLIVNILSIGDQPSY
jgi:hypothetical protein